MYFTHAGNKVTKDEIQTAYNAGLARLVHSHRYAQSLSNSISTGLALDGIDCDTRGKCYSVWDEVWTMTPKNLKECLDAAYCPE